MTPWLLLPLVVAGLASTVTVAALRLVDEELRALRAQLAAFDHLGPQLDALRAEAAAAGLPVGAGAGARIRPPRGHR